MKRAPLELTKSSPEFMEQSYVVPYEIFKLIFAAEDTVQVRGNTGDFP